MIRIYLMCEYTGIGCCPVMRHDLTRFVRVDHVGLVSRACNACEVCHPAQQNPRENRTRNLSQGWQENRHFSAAGKFLVARICNDEQGFSRGRPSLGGLVHLLLQPATRTREEDHAGVSMGSSANRILVFTDVKSLRCKVRCLPQPERPHKARGIVCAPPCQSAALPGRQLTSHGSRCVPKLAGDPLGPFGQFLELRPQSLKPLAMPLEKIGPQEGEVA